MSRVALRPQGDHFALINILKFSKFKIYNIGNAGESGLNISCKESEDKLKWSENVNQLYYGPASKTKREGTQLNYIEY